MAEPDRSSERTGRRLAKKRKEPRRATRGLSLDVPERFQDGDDAHEDVTAPRGNNTISMNQSLFSMIARAGQQSQTDLGTMQEIDSGDSEEEAIRPLPFHNLDGAARLSRLSSANEFPQSDEPQVEISSRTKHRRALSDNKLLRSLPMLMISGRKDVRSDGQSVDQMSSSQFLPPRTSPDKAPVALAEQHPDAKALGSIGKDVHVRKGRLAARRRQSASLDPEGKASPALANRLKQIFEFDQLEEVISEFPCWLLQSILLQGYMYITQRHLCFYAYIPKKHVRCPVMVRGQWLTVQSMMSARPAISSSVAGPSTTDIGLFFAGTC